MAASGTKYSTKAVRPDGLRHGRQDAAQSAACHFSPRDPRSASLSITRSLMPRHRIVAAIVQPKVTLRRSSDAMISCRRSMSRPSNSNWSASHPPAALCRRWETAFSGAYSLLMIAWGAPVCFMPLFTNRKAAVVLEAHARCSHRQCAGHVSVGWADDRNGMLESAIAPGSTPFFSRPWLPLAKQCSKNL